MTTYLNYTVGIRVLVLLSHHDMYGSCRFVNMDRCLQSIFSIYADPLEAFFLQNYWVYTSEQLYLNGHIQLVVSLL